MNIQKFLDRIISESGDGTGVQVFSPQTDYWSRRSQVDLKSETGTLLRQTGLVPLCRIRRKKVQGIITLYFWYKKNKQTNWDNRTIINLQGLNKLLKFKRFKMETIKPAVCLLLHGCFRHHGCITSRACSSSPTELLYVRVTVWF